MACVRRPRPAQHVIERLCWSLLTVCACHAQFMSGDAPPALQELGPYTFTARPSCFAICTRRYCDVVR